MKLSIARGALLDSLGVVTKALSSRTTLPILSGILMAATKDGIQLQSTDLEISIRDRVPADVDEPGSVVVPGRLLADVVRKMPDAAIRMETKAADRIEVSCRSEKAGTISFILRTLAADDFPRFPSVSPDKTATIQTSLMGTMVRQVSKAVSRDEARPILTGVLLVMDGTEIRMVATDSYRLAVRTAQTETPVGETDRGRHPREGARGGTEDRRRRARGEDGSVGQPGRLRVRGHHVRDPPHRGDLPELPAAGALGRGDEHLAGPLGVRGGGGTRVAARATQRTAAPEDRGQHADAVGHDTGCRRGERGPHGGGGGPSPRDSVQPRLPARRRAVLRNTTRSRSWPPAR